ncbi:F-box/LRR-repeat protein At3g26922-like [Mangifera indica]|uniref:F-box/LRR-repeat protein At3g26922-like n=1 Tax=Mangifera indica TaxID=29780 RepID=UPI001CFBA77C|nr:F-box/LRR-repeat protein At3g26922-like [Mangifera indica]
MTKVQNRRLQATKYDFRKRNPTTHEVQISMHKTKKIDSHEKDVDRLSNLPDDIIRRILSLMDTRSAVKTCVLSKQWEHYWTEIESIKFDDKTFNKWRDYAKYIRCVLRRRKPFRLHSLTYNCSGRKDKSLVSRIFNYAKKYNVEVLDTDVSTFSPRFYECKTLKTLIVGPIMPNPFDFESLTTLQLVGVWLYNVNPNHDLFSSCLNLKNLILINCQIPLDSYNICAPELAKLTVSNIADCTSNNKTLVISAPKLKIFEFSGMYPLVLRSDDCLRFDIVDIQFSLPPTDSLEEYNLKNPYISGLIAMAEGFDHAKSVTISFKFSKGKLVLHRNYNTPETKTKVIPIHKDVGEGWSFDLAIVGQRLALSGFHMKWMATKT